MAQFANNADTNTLLQKQKNVRSVADVSFIGSKSGERHKKNYKCIKLTILQQFVEMSNTKKDLLGHWGRKNKQLITFNK